jgi:predicted alpha/beta-fold hydrolase
VRPIVIIAPALGGTSAHGYIRILVKQLVKKAGYVCCVLNVRGTTQPLKTKR